MTPTDGPGRTLRTGYLIGAVVMFLFALGVAALFDVTGWTAVVAALFIAVFAGGALGMMVAGRLNEPTGAGRPARRRGVSRS
jgi:hypothetical protein